MLDKKRIKKAQESLIDFLLEVLPDIEGIRSVTGIEPNDPAAKKLYAIWEDESNKIANRSFDRPVTMSSEEVSELETAGYIEKRNNKIRITDQGAEILNKMILSNDKSIYDTEETSKIRKGLPLSRTASCKVRPSNWYEVSKEQS